MFKCEICEQKLQYECKNTGMYRDKPCLSNEHIQVVQGIDHINQKFDMNLRLLNTALNDAGVYTVKVTVINPDGTEDSFSKTFKVYMIGKL